MRSDVGVESVNFRHGSGRKSQWDINVAAYDKSAFLLGVKGGSGQPKILVETPENQRPVGRSNDLRAEQQGGAP